MSTVIEGTPEINPILAAVGCMACHSILNVPESGEIQCRCSNRAFISVRKSHGPEVCWGANNMGLIQVQFKTKSIPGFDQADTV